MYIVKKFLSKKPTYFFPQWVNKGKELSIYPPFPGHTCLQCKQIIDEGQFLCREIFLLRKRGGTKSMHQHFANPNELMDPGNDYQWVRNSADEELMGNLTMDGSG